ncbi:MAG: FxsA family protein [Pelagibacteraceae bacterium]
MNSLLLLIIGIPAIEILTIIKVGQNIGGLNTVFLIFFTAFIGIYYARIEGINTVTKAINNIYKNETPIYEMFSGASIAFAVVLLIIPGFFTDVLGFILLIPFTRKKLINFLIMRKNKKNDTDDILDGEIIERKDKDKDEL